MRIGYVSHWFDPEGGAAGHPGIAARALMRRGHDLTVLTGFPHYPRGEVFDGYRVRPHARESIDGMDVHRTPIYPSHNVRAVARAANYLSYSAAGAMAAPRCLAKVDVALVYSTPATAAVPALVLKATRRVPFAVWIQDMWPQSVTSSGFLDDSTDGRVERTLHRFCDTVYRHASLIGVTSPGMADLVLSRGVPARKVRLVPNWADESAFRPTSPSSALRAELGLSRRFTLMYAGNLGEMQGLGTLIEAAALLQDRSDVGIAIVGGGVLESPLKRQAQACGLDNVQFIPSQPFARMSDVLALADVLLVSLKDVPLLRSTTPSKLQASLAVGKPVLGAVAGDAAKIIASSGAGRVTAPGDAAALATAVRCFADDSQERLAVLGKRAREHYSVTFSEKIAGDLLSTLVCDAADRP